ncbi:MAG: microcystin degradation protein MlrC [Halieaceae bacterium]|jgi:microcystin degradation protein MlrC
MRCYVGAISHETNRFSPFPTVLDDYKPAAIGYNDLIEAAVAEGCELIHGFCAHARPSGPTRQADYEQLRDRLIADICAAGDIDLVLLFLHGAQVAEHCDDCEGDTLAHLRRAVGESMPVGVMLDLHASVSLQMLEHANLLLSIKEYPHTDFPQTARQLARLSLACARGEITPCAAFNPVPVFGLWHTPVAPSLQLVERARSLESDGTALHISLVHGFPWADVADAGAAVIVYTDAQPDLALALAEDFAHELWSIRASDLDHYLDIENSLDAALAATQPGLPALIADAADNPGAGTGSDATWILQAVLKRKLESVALGMFWDPAALATITAAGEGAVLELGIGGHTGALAGDPVVARAEVERIVPNAYIDAMPGYPPLAAGTLACLRIGSVRLVVSAYREQVFGPALFTAVGIDLSQQSIVVVKSAQHFYAAFAPLASRIIYCDSPCSRSIAFAALPFKHRRQPMWPLDPCELADLPVAMLPGTQGPGCPEEPASRM